MKRLNLLLVFIPIALVLHWAVDAPILVFVASALAIVPLAGLMGDATESLAEFLGPTLGGLLNATLGNAPEIIIALFALHRGLIHMVKASLTGSIVGNLLFGLGASMVPAIYRLSPRHEHDPGPEVSLEIATILFLVYGASLVFTLVTSKPVVGQAGVKAEKAEAGEVTPQVEPEEETGWSPYQALGILIVVTIALAIMSEVLTSALDPAAKRMHLTERFAGVFLLAMVGNAAELFNAVRFARKDKMDLAIGITVGASTQVALLVAPILVFAGCLMGRDMNLLFAPYEMWAIIMAVYIARNLIYDGSSNWLEGLVLIGIYLMLGVGFFYLPA
jgi:Ca2+:H+ antiporter